MGLQAGGPVVPKRLVPKVDGCSSGRTVCQEGVSQYVIGLGPFWRSKSAKNSFSFAVYIIRKHEREKTAETGTEFPRCYSRMALVATTNEKGKSRMSS